MSTTFFRKTTRSARKRFVRAAVFWLVAGVMIVAGMAGVIYFAYERGAH